MENNKLKTIINNLSFNFPYTIDEFMERPIIENFHYHSSFSNTSTPDSPTDNESYAKKIVEYGSKCIFSGEHGSQGNVFEVYQLSEKYNLKYRHSTEAYWVKNRLEKDNTNCHINLIGINDKGRKDINFALSMANIDGYYYKPRLDLDLLLNIPKDNIIVTSACIAGWKYDDCDEIWLKIWEHFKENFFLEVQPHNTEKQKKLNKHILELSKKYGIQIICGLDSHFINAEDSIKRDKVLEYKKIFYDDNENGWDMDYPSFNEIYNRFVEQGVLNEENILVSMLNTNIFNSDKFEEIIFDKNFKIPCVYPNTTYEERCNIFKDIITKEYQKEKDKSQERVSGIKFETKQITDSGVVDYFLTTKKILEEAINNQGGVLTTTSRGSMSSFYVNKLLGFTTVDRFTSEIPIYPERFLTKERVEAGQMPDCDFNIATQEPFFKASRVVLGEQGCYPLMAIEQLKEKASWQLFASVNGIEPQIANEVSKYIDKYNETLKYADEDEKEFIKIDDYIPKEYIDIYKKSIEYQGIVINLKCHACGHLLLDGDIRSEIGLISAISETTGKRTLCACVEGKYLDDFGYVKEDFLIVDSVGLIKECWDSIGKEVPTFNELRELVKNDSLTWDIYKNGITCCINQMEKESTTKKCMKYKPHDLAELSALISAIRPGFRTLIDKFLNRESYTTGEVKIDNLLKDSSHFMLFQESIMKVLGFLGLPMGDTYSVIKNISKKKYKKHPEKLAELKDNLKSKWIQEIGNLDNFDNVWNVIDSASLYSFNAPHALSMGGDSAYLAYFKSHYTAKFYEVAINHYQLKDKKDKINDLTNEIIKFYGYKIGNCKFGEDNRKVIVDEKNKIIYPNMNKIKGMQKVAPEIFYELGKNNYNDLFFIFRDILNSELNKTSIDIMIKLNYFCDYGDINFILNQLEIYKKMKSMYNKFNTCKQLKKDECINIGFDLKEVRLCAKIETEKMFKDFDNKKLIDLFNKNYISISKNLSEEFQISKTTDYDIIHYQLQILGSSDKIIPNSSLYGVESIEINQYGTPFITLYEISSGQSKQYKCDKKYFNSYPCEQGDILNVAFRTNKKKKLIGQDESGKNIWENSDDTETIIKIYAKKF